MAEQDVSLESDDGFESRITVREALRNAEANFQDLYANSAIGIQGTFSSIADAEASLAAGFNVVTALGFGTAGDGGYAKYVAVTAEPSHDGKLQVGAIWYELAESDPDPRMFGAKCDHREVTDAAITAASTDLTSATAAFTAADIGKVVIVQGAGPNAAGLRSSIVSVTNSTTAVLDDAASTTVSSVKLWIATDDTLAVARCWRFANLKGRRMHLGPYTYYVGRPNDHLLGDTEFLISTADVSGIIGAGREYSRFIWDDSKATTCELFGGAGSPTVSPRLNDCRIEGVRFTGTYEFHGGASDGATSVIGAVVFPIRAINNVTIRDNLFEYMRASVITPRSVTRFQCTGNILYRNAKDGIFTQTTETYDISNNFILFGNDDSIQVGTTPEGDGSLPVMDGGLISNNTTLAAGSIKVSGGQSVNVVGNRCLYSNRSAIRIQDLDTNRTKAGPSGILVAGNIIINCLDHEQIDGAENKDGQAAILVLGNGAQAGTADAIPGDNATGTGEIVSLYDWLMRNPDEPATIPKAPPVGIKITDNIVQRIAFSALNFSDYGLGTLTERGDFAFDPEIPEEAFLVSAVDITGRRVRNVDISDNLFSGIGAGVRFSPATNDAGVMKFDGIRIVDNILWDLAWGGILADSLSLRDGNLSGLVAGNTFDLDPLHKHASRGADGSWTTRDDLVAIGDLASATSANRGLIVRDNTFRNVSSVFPTNYDGNGDYTCLDNVVDATVAAVGFSTSNKGVGYVPAPSPAFRVRHVQCDPTQSTFGGVINDCPIAMAAKPTTGTWVAGQFVWRVGASVSSTVASLGWLRLTTGSSHTLGTDWLEIKTTGSPADLAQANTFTQNLTVNARMRADRFQTNSSPIADDAVITFPTVATWGQMTILSSVNPSTKSGVLRWSNTTITVVEGLSGWTLATPGTDLTGTTGTDGNLTLSIHNNELHLENRSGSSFNVIVHMIG